MYELVEVRKDDVYNHPYSTPPSPEDLYNILRRGKPKTFRHVVEMGHMC